MSTQATKISIPEAVLERLPPASRRISRCLLFFFFFLCRAEPFHLHLEAVYAERERGTLRDEIDQRVGKGVWGEGVRNWTA